MRKHCLALTATLAVVGVMIGGRSHAAVIDLNALQAAADEPAADELAGVELVQFTWRGRPYCWYYTGWRGPGWYRCGFRWRRGLGWGGPVGWHGWRRPGMRPGRPGNRPGINRPGGNRPGINRPGGNRPGANRPGGNRPEANRPGGNRPGTTTGQGGGRPGMNRPSGNRPGGGGRGGNRGRGQSMQQFPFPSAAYTTILGEVVWLKSVS
jgi:hypothetical protein